MATKSFKLIDIDNRDNDVEESNPKTMYGNIYCWVESHTGPDDAFDAQCWAEETAEMGDKFVGDDYVIIRTA